jgi:hypothetical protein
MRNTPRIKRVQLNVSQDDESVIFGIVSAEPDYKLSLALNKNLKISLKNSAPVKFNDDSGYELNFSRFSDSSASNNLTYDLTSNRSGKNYLIRKLKNIDYILRIYDPDNEINTDETVTIIRDTECITAVFNIHPGTIKDKNLNHLIH